MCCFSRPVEKVADTSIFARSSKEGRQFIVYSMMLSAKEDLAMILPIPVPRKSKEDAVRFINLEKYPEFFADLRAGFPEDPLPAAAGRGRSLGLPKSAPKLKVVEVGSYEASFVPSVADFSRLDERFRLPATVWDKLPAYKDFGFAVFKLKKGHTKVHPMAFEFPRANSDHLFVPTVHIHDGKVHAKARFDHALYCQIGENDNLQLADWRESPQHARSFMKIDKLKGLLEPDAHCYRKVLRGELENKDTLV
jgi:hypothetical protein